MVLNNPFDREKEPLNHDIFERFFGSIDILKKRKEFVEKITKEVIDNVDKHISDKNPDLLINFSMTHQEITRQMEMFDKSIKTVEKKLKKLVDSTSLYEDVYKMRDEMKEIKKVVDKFNEKIKKAFS